MIYPPERLRDDMVFGLPTMRFDDLLAALQSKGITVVGPTVRDGAIVLEEIATVDELPHGWRDQQQPGRYRIHQDGQGGLFQHNLGPQSFKKVLHPAKSLVWRGKPDGDSFVDDTPADVAGRTAILGARACDLAAIAIQDRVLHDGGDPRYASRRDSLVVIAVQCSQAASTCFCPSMGTGPRVQQGHDLCLTEVERGFVVEVGSEFGESLVQELALSPADPPNESAPQQAAEAAEADIERHLPTEGLREKLMAALESPKWDEVAQRCIGCANCTMVCPTCFCTTVEDHTTLDGAIERHRRWDSCFDPDFSYIHGGAVRESVASRYRQWLTHKLSTWWDQFGTSGCVGCGRCITWCPAGIDITQEAIRIVGADHG